MIKFFRKIRYNLMEQNKTGKYLKYAIGEIVLVMIGILLALQVNTWNINQKNKLIENNYLILISKQLQQHIETYESNIQYALKRLYSIDYVLNHLETDTQELVADTLVVHLNIMQWISDLNIDTNLYKDLVNTGNIKLFENDFIRISIQNYFHLSEEYNDAIIINNRFYIDNGINFYMRYLSMGHIIKSIKGLDTDNKRISNRELFELWNLGYQSAEMKEFENNLYFRRAGLDLEIFKNEKLMQKAKSLIKEINIILD